MKHLRISMIILAALALTISPGTAHAQDLDAIVTPDAAELEVGQGLQIEVFPFAINANNRTQVDADRVEWIVSPDTLGTITDDGFFIAGRHAGKVTIRVAIHVGNRVIIKEIEIRIGRLPRRFFDLKVVPGRAVVPAGAEKQFHVVVSRANVAIRPAFVRWEVVPEGLGTIDADGLFTAGQEVGHGRVVAHVEIDGLRLRASAHVVVSPAATAAITGNIVSDAGGAIEGANVRAVRLGRVRWIQHAQSDASGDYVLGELIPGIYVITAKARGFIGEFYDNTRNYLEATPQNVAEGDTVSGINFGLSEGGKILGSVFADGDSAALPGAHVVAFLVVNPRLARHAVADSSGNYGFEALPSGSYAVRANANGYKREYYDDSPSLAGAAFVDVDEPNTVAGIDFGLAMTSGIQGTVTSQVDGAPIAGAHIVVYGRPSSVRLDRHVLRETRSDENGNYLIEVRPGSYILFASAEGFNGEFYDDANERRDATTVAVKADSHTTGIDFALSPRSTISGTVTDELTGNPIPGAVVVAHREHRHADLAAHKDGFRARSDSSGNYVIQNVRAGSYLVVANAHSYLPEFYDDVASKREATPVVVAEDIPVTGIDFTLIQGGSISGTVASNVDSLPVPKALVVVFDSTSGRHVRSYTNEDGDYEFGGLPTGKYFVRVVAEGFFPQFYENARHRRDATGVEVVAPNETPDIDFYLVPHRDTRGTIAGRVVSTGDDAPLHGAVVIAVSPKNRVPHLTFTGPRGFYRITDLPAGRYYVFAWAEEFVGEFYKNAKRFKNADPVFVGSDGATTTGINFGLDPAQRDGIYAIRGKVRRSDGRGLDGILVHARLDGEVEVNATTDVNGNYVLTGLQAGAYKVEATGAGYEDSFFGGTNDDNAAPVSVGGGEDAGEVNLTLDEDNITSVSTDGPEVPVRFGLAQNYPNPFNPETNIQYQLAGNSDVTLKIFNMLGQEIRTLVNSPQNAGSYTVRWDGKDASGRQVATGIYIFQLKAGESFRLSRTMLMVK